jgi:hypothetical protein
VPAASAGTNKGDYIPVSPLDGKRRLVSLWDMIQILAKDALEATWSIEQIVKFVKRIKDENASQVATLPLCQNISNALEPVDKISEKLNLTDTKKRIALMKSQLKHGIRNVSEVYADLQGLFRSFVEEFRLINFVFIHADKVKFFEKDLTEALFGKDVYAKFESARSEIKNAGNCLAADLNTAAVFHLMRVVNMGLREIAWSLGIKKIKGKKLEYCRDETIISEIETAIDLKLESVDTLKRGERWEKEKSFYRGVLVDLRYFKDVIRDPIAHARKNYTERGAMDVYDNVRDFMQRLAGSISTTHERENKKIAKRISKVLFGKVKTVLTTE